MTKIDRLLIGVLVLGVWALVAMQFFGGMTASASGLHAQLFERGESFSRPLYVQVVGEVEVLCNNCE